MTFAFDIDGTITRFPDAMREMMAGLRLRGNRVLVLTGKQTPIVFEQKDNPDRGLRISQLKGFDIKPELHFDELFIACGPVDQGEGVGIAKAKIMVDEKVDLFIDDSARYVNTCRHHAPNVAVLYVVP